MDHEPAAASRRALKTTLVRPGYCIGMLGSLVVAVTRAPPTVQSTLDFTAQIDAVFAKYPTGVSVVIAPRAPRPALSSEATKSVIDEWKRVETQLACAAIVFRASGVVGAMQRSLVATVLGMRRSSVPIKVSSNPFDVASFITRHDDQHPAGPLLGLALQSFIQEHEG